MVPVEFNSFDRVRVKNLHSLVGLVSIEQMYELLDNVSLPNFIMVYNDEYDNAIHEIVFFSPKDDEKPGTIIFNFLNYKYGQLITKGTLRRFGDEVGLYAAPDISEDEKNVFIAFWLGIQFLSIHRPQVFLTGEKQVIVPKFEDSKKTRVSHYETKMVRYISLNEEELTKQIRIYTCPAWTQAGHWVHRKNGTVYWQKACIKGKKRNDPTALVPKTYQIPNERQEN